MKKLLLPVLLSLLMSMVGTKTFAHDIEVANADSVTIYYVWTNNNTELAVSYRGSLYSEFSNEYSGNVVIPESVVYEEKTYDVTSIGGYAFYGCSDLTSVVIPNSVTKIGWNAFCNCDSLTSVTIGNGVASIDEDAFYNCISLNSITIPSSVASISEGAFSGCRGLNTIKVEDGNAEYDSRNECNAIIRTSSNTLITGCKTTVIPNSVTSIGNYAFYGCSGLSSIMIPDSVTSIGNFPFYGCSDLMSIEIPKSVTSIGNHAFEESGWYNSQPDGLLYLDDCLLGNKGENKPSGSVVIKEGTRLVANNAFSDCSGLTSVTIPNSVKSIGSWAFRYCSGLTSIVSEIVSPFEILDNVFYCNDADIYATATLTVPADTKSAYQSTAGWNKFQNIVEASVIGKEFEVDGIRYIVGENKTVSVISKTEKYAGNIVIPDQVEYNGDNYAVTSIAQSAFEGCVEMTSVSIPNSVTVIGESAFEGCTGLSSVVIPNSLTKIDEGTFYSCTGLKSIDIPDGVITIGQGAFSKCSSLTSVTIAGSVTSIDNNAFYDCINLHQIISEIENPFAINKSVFYNGVYTTATLFVPIGTKAAYRSTAGWSSFQNIVEAKDFGKEFEVDGISFKIGENKTVSVISKTEKYTGNVVIPNKVEYNGDYFVVISIAQSAFEGCIDMTSVSIPDSVTTIEESAFEGCSGLSSIEIPNSVRTIGPGAFYGCTGLKSLNITDGVTKIGRGAFSKCSGLTSITISGSVTSIDDYAFWDCTNLMQITSEIEKPFAINKTVFPANVFSTATLFVPFGTKSLYQSTAGWNSFRDIAHVNGIYKLTYYVDGEEYVSINYEYGEDIIPEAEPTKEGYTFSGWSNIPNRMPANDVTVNGTFKINKYKLIYMVDSKEYKSLELEYGADITPETEPSKEGYTFSGWSQIPETMPATDIIIFGSFDINQYTITYVIDGEQYTSETVDFNSVIIPPTPPIREGLDFAWEEYPETMPAHDITINGSYTTGIQAIGMESRKAKIFTLDGRQVNTLQKGVNVIRMDDGTIKKVVIRK